MTDHQSDDMKQAVSLAIEHGRCVFMRDRKPSAVISSPKEPLTLSDPTELDDAERLGYERGIEVSQPRIIRLEAERDVARGRVRDILADDREQQAVGIAKERAAVVRFHTGNKTRSYWGEQIQRGDHHPEHSDALERLLREARAEALVGFVLDEVEARARHDEGGAIECDRDGVPSGEYRFAGRRMREFAEWLRDRAAAVRQGGK